MIDINRVIIFVQFCEERGGQNVSSFDGNQPGIDKNLMIEKSKQNVHSIHVILLHAIPAILHAISALTRLDQNLRYCLRNIENLDKKMNHSRWVENEDV